VEIEVPFRYDLGFDGQYGPLEVTEVSDEVMRGAVAVRPELKQVAGIVHGGVYASIAESLASLGTAFAVVRSGQMAIGLSNQTTLLRPISEGTIHAEATRKHRGRTTWVWEVEISDDEGRLCVLTRMTVAVRDAASAAQGDGARDTR
jgi:1,4-dihydroxy-2-naphthoyl-CoA hydrolase